MLINEKWIRWEPLHGLKVHYYFVSVTDNAYGLEVILQLFNDDDNAVRICFKRSVVSYRLIDESYAFGILPTDEMLQDPRRPWRFFKVENSNYLKWFIETSSGMVEIYGQSDSFTHFSILAEDSFLDVIAFSEPMVEFINIGSHWKRYKRYLKKLFRIHLMNFFTITRQ